MAENAYIKLVPGSLKQTISVDEIKEYFQYYKEITTKAGQQLNWDYTDSAFPYDLKETDEGKGSWFYLSAKKDRYYAILIGIDNEIINDDDGGETEQTYIQITLTERSTAGDKGKANEFCKFLAKKLKAELHLYNGRIMYFNPRK